MNNEIMITEKTNFYYDEMISHPALFTHPQPKKTLIVGHHHGTVQEVLKHLAIEEVWCVSAHNAGEQPLSDPRVKYHFGCVLTWLKEWGPGYFDIIIHNHCASLYIEKTLQTYYQSYFQALGTNGIVVQPCPSSLIHVNAIQTIIKGLQQAGFNDWQSLNFPQPHYESGTRTVVLAMKGPDLVPRIREKDIYNRIFTTRYYNYDTHRAALAMPEFVKEALLG